MRDEDKTKEQLISELEQLRYLLENNLIDTSELKRTEERLSEAQKIAHIGNFEWFPGSGLSRWSAETYRIFWGDEGLFEAGLEKVLELVHPDDRAKVHEKNNTGKTGSPWDYEYRICHPSGEIRTIHSIGRPELDETGQTFRVVGTIQDITEKKRVQDALEESEALLSQSAEIANLGYAIWDCINDKYITVSEGYAGIFGYTKEEFLATITDEEKDIELIYPEDRDHYSAYYDDENLENQVPEIEYRIIRCNDKIRHVVQRNKYVFDAIGQRTQELVTIQDITKRKQVEAELQKSEKRYRQLYNKTPIMLYSTDSEGCFIDINEYTLEKLGYKQDELIGQKGIELLTEESRKYAEEVVLPQLFEQGFCQDAPHQLIKKNGEVFDVEFSASLEWGDQGKFDSILGIAIDVTERKKAAEKIAKWERIFQYAGWGVCISQPNHKLNLINPAFYRMLGYESDELIDSNIMELYPPGIRSEISRYVGDVDLKGHVTFEAKLLRKDGSVFPVFMDVSSVKDDQNNVLYRVVNIQDITEHKQLELQLQQSQKMEALGTLAGGVAHDFNNMLLVILSNAEMSLETLPQESSERPLLERILEAGERATSLVKQILIFSRMEAIHLELVNLSSVIKEALKMVKATLPAQIEVQQNLPEKSPPIMADATQIHQIFLNLCANASYAMEATGGILEIKVEILHHCPPSLDISDRPCLRMTVKDNGPGIPPEIQERIFDPFFTTKERGKGTGMGLSVVHGIVEKHQGKITLQSKIGEGTTFSIYFPTAKEAEVLDESAKEAPEKKDSSGSQLSGTLVEEGDSTQSLFDSEVASAYRMQHILVAEDESTIRYTYKTFLEDCGYGVTICDNGAEAFTLFKENPEQFDLVITDQGMPQMTGKQLAQELLALQPNLSIILLTGYSDVISEKEAQAIGIQRYLVKPIQLKTLQQAIEECLERVRNHIG